MYPIEFLSSLADLAVDADALIKSLDKSLKPTYRINTQKTSTLLSPNDIKLEYAADAFRVCIETNFTSIPEYHLGHYYVQEASSIFLENLLLQLELPITSVVLDMCAAPGGKSIILSDYFKDGTVVSNEMDPLRAQVLSENIQKWGNRNHLLTRLNGNWFSQLNDHFDLVVLDAPCSGEGMFRKDPYAIKDWSANKVKTCQVAQSQLINTAYECLKPGGILIYSTCTYNTLENEDHFSDSNFIAPELNFSAPKGVKVSSSNAYVQFRFFPHLFDGEGLCIHVLQKPLKKDYFRHTPVQLKTSLFASDLVLLPSDFISYQRSDIVYALPNSMVSNIPFKLSDQIFHFGVHLGNIKGKDFIPAQNLLTSGLISLQIERIPLDRTEAIKFLQLSTFPITTFTSPGWKILTHQQHDLGWIKQISTMRYNNYYPKHWRIKSQYISG